MNMNMIKESVLLDANNAENPRHITEDAMRTRRIIFNLVVVVLCFHGCTGPDVKTDFDPSADFSKFHTFAFLGLTDINRGGDILDNSLTRKRIESIVARELTKKGLQQVEVGQHPDLLVHYWLGVREKQEVVDTGGAYGAYGWRGGGAAYGGVRTYNYKEGTLIVDLVEPKKKELMWRATTVGNMQDTSQENIALADKAITEAFEHYPPPAKS